MTPRGYPNFNSYVKNLRVLVFRTDGRMDRGLDRQRNTPAARGLEELFCAGLERGSLSPFTLCMCIARIRLETQVNNKYISMDFLVKPKFSSCT